MAIQFTDKELALFKVVAKAASSIQTQAFAVGGFVRDKILDRPTKDIDIA
jgi:tRNA nucleotidyltransferase/poly(A) polymerase